MAETTSQTSSLDAEALYVAARRAAKNAYARYSGFHVGSAVLSKSGRVYTGCNVENVSYPLGSCAETAAIAEGRAAEGEAFVIEAILVYAETSHSGQAPCTPCGGCRQRIVEFGPRAHVLFYDSSLKRRSMYASDLLPFGFTFDPEAK